MDLGSDALCQRWFVVERERERERERKEEGEIEREREAFRFGHDV
jgi:hypothetical protein